MGRWDDTPEDTPDDWRGWTSGKYDNRYGKTNHGRNSRHNKSKTKSATVGIVFVIIIGVFGLVLLDQGFLDSTIQHAPKTIQDVSNTAKNITKETVSKLKETIDESLTAVELESIDIDDIKNVVVKIPEQNQLGQPIIDKIKLEKQIHSLTNQYRTQNGLQALSWDDKLANIARTHSQDMALRDYFSHDTLEGKDPTDRGTSQGYRCQKTIGNLIYSGIAENIFQNNLYDSVTIIGIVPIYDWNSQDSLTKSTVDGWMNSPGHRENILESNYDKEGIGVAIASDDKVYITQNFC